VLQGADRRLTEVRRTVPDAGALVIATDHQDAKAYAALLERIVEVAYTPTARRGTSTPSETMRTATIQR
jgi:hypothetical protein